MRTYNSNMKELIIRFLDGSITSSEKETLLLWLKEDKENRKTFLEMHDVWVTSGHTGKDFNAKKKLNVFVKRVRDYESRKKKKSIKTILYTSISAAAVIALIFTLTNLLTSPKSFEQADETFTQIVQAKHAKERIVLPDGTTVWLSKNAILSYPRQFAGRCRQVKMEGKAYFEVTKNKRKPFIVDLGEDKIEVLGTSFNVRNYKTETDNEIVLLTGRVGLHLAGVKKDVILKPNEKVVYSKTSKAPKIETVDASLFNVWTKDRLVFDNEKLSYVIANLKIWYDVEIECPVNLAERTRVSFTIVDETKEQMLKVLALVAPIKYVVNKDKIYITPN